MAEIRIENVTKSFASVTAVRDLNLTVNDGELFVILGPTGAGKTTTLRCIAGLEHHETGNIYIGGSNVNRFGPANRNIAFVFQHYSLYPNFSVRENLEFPLRSKTRKLSEVEIEERILDVAKVLHIEHLLGRVTDKLSGGEMQRVTIGRAIVRNPKVFLMDEPLSNLDAKLEERLRAELKRLQHELGATILLVTHDQVEAMTIADRIGILNQGQLCQIAEPLEIYNRPKDIFVAEFVGSPAINIFKASINDSNVLDFDGSFTIQLEKPVIKKLKGYRGKVQAGIRPEDISIWTVNRANRFEAVTFIIENMGMEKIVSLKLHKILIRVVTDPDFESGLNKKVYLQLNQSKLKFFHYETGKTILQ